LTLLEKENSAFLTGFTNFYLYQIACLPVKKKLGKIAKFIGRVASVVRQAVIMDTRFV